MPAKYPPGPRDVLFGWPTLSRIKADVLGAYTALHRQYGDSVSFRTGPFRLFVFYHPDQVRDVLVAQSKSFVRFPRVMQTLAQWNGSSILIVEGDRWIRQRRLVQPAFGPKRMGPYGDTMVACTRRLVETWHAGLGRDGYLDIDTNGAMTALTLSIICKTFFDREAEEISSEIAGAVAALSEVAFVEMQAPVRVPSWIPTRLNRRKRWAMATLDRIVWEFVRERRREGRDHGDLLSMLLAAVDEDAGGARLDDRQVRDEAMTLLLAGHDTAAAALDWFWYSLARYPEVASRCREEVDRVVGSREPAAADVPRLAFVEATIKETLRLYPPAIGVFLRQNTSDIRIAGYDVPRKSLVTLSSYVTQRDARWFPEPERFDPERFMGPRRDNIPSGAYFPFGAGPRVCIGQAFAMQELALVAATILQSCDVSLPPGAPEPQPHVHMSLRPKHPLILRWRRRT